MSYLDMTSKIHTLEETSYGNTDDYTYEDFKREMAMLESTMYDEVNSCVDEMSINAIHALTEGASIDKNTVKNTKKYVDSVFKDSCNSIYDKQTAYITSTYNRAHKIISQKIQFMEEHKIDIENMMIGSSYNKCEGKCKKVGDVSTYTNLFKPLKKSFPSVDSKLSSKEYRDKIMKVVLGDKTTVPSDLIEKNKKTLMKNLITADSNLSLVINNSLKSCRTYIPSSFTEKTVSEYKKYSDEAVRWVKEYSRAITMYCNEIAILLKKFIVSDEGGK